MEEDKRQFNIYLPSGLVKELKRAALESDRSLSKFVEDVLREYLDKTKEAES